MEEWEGLISSQEDIKSVARRKSKPEETKRVDAGSENVWLSKGYIVDSTKSNTKSTYLTRYKTPSEVFEDKVWICFSHLNFKYMNSNNRFRIRYTNNPEVEPQQIDVFAADDDVALVIECKNAVSDKNKIWKDTFLRISQQKSYMTKQIQDYFKNPNMSVSYVFITNNYEICDSDKKVAADFQIILLNNNDVDYYNMLSKNIGEAAKYHVLADVFEKRPISSLKVQIPAIKGQYNNTSMYAFMIQPSKLLPLSYVAHRVKNSKQTSSTYQRMIKKSRIDQIRKYIIDGGQFPNSIIISIDSDVDFEVEQNYGNTSSGVLTLPNVYKSAWIIDGQHRLFSYCGLEEADTSFIPVVAFEKLSYQKQSEIFISINSKQSKVDKNLLLEINSESHWDSDKPDEWLDALISRCILEMSRDRLNPLYNKLKSNTEETGGDLTITSLTSAISKNRLFGQVINGQFQFGPLASRKRGEEFKELSLERGKAILSGYFDIFAKLAPSQWSRARKDQGYLCTNNGVTALIIVLSDILAYLGKSGEITSMSEKKILEAIKPYAMPVAEYFEENDGTEIIKEFKGQQGAHGQSRCALDMEVIINHAIPEFTSDELERHKERTMKKWEDMTKEEFPRLRDQIIDTAISALKSKYGDDSTGWWKKGVPEEVRIEIAQRKEEDVEEHDNEYYITLSNVKQIIETRDWDLFRKFFAMTTRGRKKKDQLSWFDDVEKIDKLIISNGRITQDEYDKLREVSAFFNRKIEDAEYLDNVISEDGPESE